MQWPKHRPTLNSHIGAIMTQEPLPTGSTIGILGGGQLGRMMAMAATKLGYQTHILCPEHDCPAAAVSDQITTAGYTDIATLTSFTESVDVVTLEFENIPLIAAKTVEKHGALFPSSHVLEVCQHRMKEKQSINDCGIQTAPFKAATSLEEAAQAAEEIGFPCIFKTCTMGYDGKGQVKVDSTDAVQPAWEQLASDDVIIEGFVPFDKEASVIVARNQAGEVMCYPLVENIHKNHILHQTIAPADLPESVEKEAKHIATTLAEKLELIGIMAVELFVGKDGSLKVNELAPRPHNSGHWSIDACEVSQFEQVIRAVVGLPLQAPNQHTNAIMTNLIGDDIHGAESRLGANEHLHVYGKKEARPGRKMGHITKLLPAGSAKQLGKAS